MSRNLFIASAVILSVVAPVSAATTTATITFEGIPAGTILSSVDAVSPLGPVGPIGVFGYNPFLPDDNTAMIFDSSAPTGEDPDLGSPNQFCPGGGPGIGIAGEPGSPFENCDPLGNVLIVSEDLDVTDPDDADVVGSMLYFDFSTITYPFVPDNVRVLAVDVMDVESDEDDVMIRLYDINSILIGESFVGDIGDNGVDTVSFGLRGGGIDGVAVMEIDLQGSGAIDNVVIEISGGATCGNGVLEGEEACDDGNNEDGDGCSATCELEGFCGDGTVGPGEECDDGNNQSGDGCSASCGLENPFCGDGNIDPGEECDDGNQQSGDGCSASCQDESFCSLALSAFCAVEAPAPTGDDCQGKVVEMKLEYTGDDCSATTNDQEGRFECEDGTAAAEPVLATITRDEDKATVSPDDESITVGSILTIAATDNELKSNTEFELTNGGELRQWMKIHTSCSKPLNVGDQLGSVRLVEMTTTDGGTVGLPAPPTPQENCEITSSPGPHCQGKIEVLTLRYVGGDCTVSNDQEGKATCTGVATSAEPVEVVHTKDTNKASMSPTGPVVGLGDLVTITALGSNIGGETRFEVFSDGNLMQSVVLHTSCSKELNLGDRYGAFEVVAIQTDEAGMQQAGQEVEFIYVVDNTGSSTVHDVVVEDALDGVVPGSPFATLAAGGRVVISRTAFIDAATTNSVSVSGDGGACEDADTVEITVAAPPPPPWDCGDAKPIDALSMTWDGGSDVRVRAYKGSPGSTLLLDQDGIQPGTEITVSGIAGAPNDVYWEIFHAGTLTPIGESNFHVSCSDDAMNGPEDCGGRIGNGKNDDPDFVNDWLFEGMAGQNGLYFDCSQ